MSEKDLANLLNIIDSGEKIQKYILNIQDANKFFEDEKSFDAVMMNFVIIGEAVSKLTDEVKLKNQNIPWNKVKGF